MTVTPLVDVKGSDNTGGLVGYSLNKINKNYATGDVYGSGDNTGGLVGKSDKNILTSYTWNDVYGSGDNTGGLVGLSDGNITSSYAWGSVSGSDNTGGIVGQCTNGSINATYSLIAVSGSDLVGGLVGLSDSCGIHHSYWAVDVYGAPLDVDSDINAKTSTELKNATGYHAPLYDQWNVTGVGPSSGEWLFGTTEQLPYQWWQSTNVPNNPASIHSISNKIGSGGNPFGTQVNATDFEGDILSYFLVSDINDIDVNSTGYITWSNPTYGNHIITVAVSDGSYHTITKPFEISIRYAPIIDLIDDQPWITGIPYKQHVVVTDPDTTDDELIFDLITNVTDSSSMPSIDSTNGTITWDDPVAGIYYFNVTVSDTLFVADESFILNVSDNTAPIISAINAPSGRAGTMYTYNVIAHDDNVGDTLTYYLTTNATDPNIDINSTTGLITWPTPDIGVYDFTVIVSDGILNATESFILIIDIADVAPRISTTSLPSGTSGIAYTYPIKATDDNSGDTLTYSIISSELEINPVNGNITWDDPITGTYAVTVEVSDGIFKSDSTFIFHVAENIAPIITPINDQQIIVGVPYTLHVNASDANPLDFYLTTNVTDDPQPAINQTNGTITWSDPIGGTYLFNIRVSDTALDATVSFTLSPGNDYDQDDDGLIDITTPEQLNAIRWDLNGDGVPSTPPSDSNVQDYHTVFQHPLSTQCDTASGCIGYELNANLTFTDYSYISDTFTGVFDGNNYTIRDVTVKDVTTNDIGGIFSTLGGQVRNLKLVDVDIYVHMGTTTSVGGLIGNLLNTGSVTNVFVNGIIDTNATNTGGLVGKSSGDISTSYVLGNVYGSSNTGGLVGNSEGAITASYIAGNVSSSGNDTGGLVGTLDGEILASYVLGNVSSSGNNTGGLVGECIDGMVNVSYSAAAVDGVRDVGGIFGSGIDCSIHHSYWNEDLSTSVPSDDNAKSDANLKNTVSYTDIYDSWNVTGTGAPSETGPWIFGDATRLPYLWWQYATATDSDTSINITPRITPINDDTRAVDVLYTYDVTAVDDDGDILMYDIISNATDPKPVINQNNGTITWNNPVAGTYSITVLVTDGVLGVAESYILVIRDHGDSDGDGLIDITIPEQLNAIRWDLNGDGISESNTAEYARGFPSISEQCPDDGCIGYELLNDIDYTGYSYISGTFTGIFEGNNYKINNIAVSESDVTTGDIGGLFSVLSGQVRNLGMEDVDVNVRSNTTIHVGGLAGSLLNGGSITNVYLEGVIDTNVTNTGGLVGHSDGSITTSYSQGYVSGSGYTGGLVGNSTGDILSSYATSNVSSSSVHTGGLVGASYGSISSSYATGNVTSTSSGTGGLVGYSDGAVTASYATGDISGLSRTGGLVGTSNGIISSSNASGTVTGDSSNTGGLVGTSSNDISSSHATGDVSSNSVETGGLVGFSTGTINTSHATGDVSSLDSRTGGLVGFSQAPIFASNASGTVTSDGAATGGLVGRSISTISASDAHGDITGSGNHVGGLVGFSTKAISTSYATGDVRGSGNNTGGLVGRSDGSITASYTMGNVVSDSGKNTGGLVGFSTKTINESYTSGNVSSDSGDYTGGLVGNSEGSITASYTMGNVSSNSGDYTGGLVGRSTMSITASSTMGNVMSNSGDSTGGLVGYAKNSITESHTKGNVS